MLHPLSFLSFRVTELPPSIQLPLSELHFAANCVAAVCGVLGGFIAARFKWPFMAAIPAAYLLSCAVCYFFFPAAHTFYGEGTIYHRVYDSVGILAGLFAYKALAKP